MYINKKKLDDALKLEVYNYEKEHGDEQEKLLEEKLQANEEK